jgi:predicted amidohydrolase YtcJ
MSDYLDLIIEGNILTMSGSKPRAAAVGVKNGLISMTGAATEVAEYAGKNTHFLKLSGKTVVPGFIDTHCHPVQVGNAALNVDLSPALSLYELLKQVKEKIADTPPGDLVLGLNFNYDTIKEHRLPTRSELDGLSSEHPILILVYDVHSAMMNTRMLELVNIPQDMDGYIQGEDGNPTGLVEDPAIALVLKKIAPQGETALLTNIHAAMQEALRVGITTLHMKEPYSQLQTVFKHELSFPIRVKPMFMIKSQDAEDLDHILQSEIFRQRGVVAFFADGAPDSKTAAFFEPYPDELTNYGMLYYQDDELEDLISKTHRAGFQISVHTCGTRASDQALNIYRKVLAKHPRADHRHRIEHFEMPLGNQIKRAVDLGVSLAMQPMFLFLSGRDTFENIRSLLGTERANRWKPLRSILDAGGLVAGGSDAPVTKMNPLKGIQACINHPNKHQRITLYEALKLFTVNAARIGFEEHSKGRIEAGKLADFTVLSHDPNSVNRDEVGEIGVEMTIVGGKVVFSKSS